MICYIIWYRICSACSSAREGGPAKGCLAHTVWLQLYPKHPILNKINSKIRACVPDMYVHSIIYMYTFCSCLQLQARAVLFQGLP